MRERIVIDSRPRKLRAESEPYLVFLGRTFLPVIDVLELRTNKEYFLIISPQSIALEMKKWMDVVACMCLLVCS